MNDLIYILGMAALTVLLINAEPFIKMLEWLKIYKYKVFKCALCFGFYVSIVITIAEGLPFIYIPIASVLASFLDKWLYE